jgi:hypothetical protein
MREYKIKPYDAGLYFMIALATGIFLVLPVTLDTWRNILAIVSILFFLVYIVTHKKKRYQMSKFYLLYLSCLFLIIIFQSIRSVTEYGYSAYELFYALRQYIWILLAIPLVLMFKRKGDFNKVLNTIINITLFSLIIRAVTWFVYTFAGITLFDNVLYEYGISWGRNGTARIDATPLIGIVIVGLYYFYTKTRKKVYLFKLLMVFLYLIIVTQTRTLLISGLACCAIMFFLKRRKTNVRFIIQLAVLIVGAIAISLGAFDSLLNYLDLSSGVTGLGYRYYEFDYFLSLLEDGKWKFGLGILTSINSVSNNLLSGNLGTKMYLDDLGFLESFVQFGAFSILMYGLLYIYMYKVMRKCFKAQMDDYAILIIGLLAYIFIVSVPLNLFGIQRSFSIPIILAITGFIEGSYKSK